MKSVIVAGALACVVLGLSPAPLIEAGMPASEAERIVGELRDGVGDAARVVARAVDDFSAVFRILKHSEVRTTKLQLTEVDRTHKGPRLVLKDGEPLEEREFHVVEKE